jgi:hypothetical protein
MRESIGSEGVAVQVRPVKAQGLGASEIAKAIEIGRAPVYRVLEVG